MGLGVIVALIWAGCGSSGENSPTKAEFTRQANAICSKWQRARDERYEAVQSKFAPLNRSANKEKAIIFLLSPYKVAINSLGELTPPAEEEEKVEAFVQAMEEAMARVKKEPLAATKKSVFQKPNELIEAYGLKECRV